MKLLFVYGTLRKGYSNHYFLMNSPFIGADSITADDISYPPANMYGIIHGDGKVVGEVYEIDEEVEHCVDFLESIDRGLYSKEQVTTHAGREVITYFSSYWLTHRIAMRASHDAMMEEMWNGYRDAT